MTLLRINGLTASYGHAQALFGVELEVAPGEVVALMGRNGVGKTTTVRCLMGMLPGKAAELTFDGNDLLSLPSHAVARLGLGLVPEGRRCFGPLTVTENLTAAARSGHWTLETVAELFPRLAERGDQVAASLSGGEQQMLAIGRALMTNPRLLVLDEATEGLAPVVRQEIWRAIGQLKCDTELAILVVDKAIRELAEVADRAVILSRGETVWQGRFANLDEDLTDRYLGV